MVGGSHHEIFFPIDSAVRNDRRFHRGLEDFLRVCEI